MISWSSNSCNDCPVRVYTQHCLKYSTLHTAFIVIRTAELKLIRTKNSQIGNESRKEPKWMLHTARERSRIEQVHSWD